MNAVEIIALIFAIVIIVKVIMVLFVKQKGLIAFAKGFFKSNVFLNIFFVVLIVVVGYFLLQWLNIVQIAAAGLLGILIYGLMLVQNREGLLTYLEGASRNKGKLILPSIPFIILAIWVLIALF